jgi:hypothetical protein
MIIIGYNLLFTTYNLASFLLGTAILGIGTAIYLIKLHQHYLWVD